MELYMCGFNAHNQILYIQDNQVDEILHFIKVQRGVQIDVCCNLWSFVVMKDGGNLLHQGFRRSGQMPVHINDPPSTKIRSVFGDIGGVLGSLSTDGSLLVFQDEPNSKNPIFRKYKFAPDCFLVQQDLTIDHLAIADNGAVCICTNSASCRRSPSSSTSSLSNETPQFTVSSPTANYQIHTFASFDALLHSEPATATYPISTSVISLLGSATGFVALTSAREVLTFGSALHPQALGRIPTVSSPAETPCPIPFFGGVPIRKVAVGGWIGAAISEDRDLYVWGGRVGDARSKRINALPRSTSGEEVRLVDINGGVDVVDVGVGAEHIVVLTQSGEVWVTGNGKYGQLGNGKKEFVEDWVQVRIEWERRGRIVGVGCGTWSSWILVDQGSG